MTPGTPTVLERLRAVRGVSYLWRSGEEARARCPESGRREIGVLAQDVEAVFPEAVMPGPGGIRRVDYSALVAVLVEAVKELDARVQELEMRVDRGAS